MITIHGWEVKPTLFPDNTCQVWKLPEALLRFQQVEVTWHFNNMSEFLELAQLKSLLDKYNVQATLYMSYLPFARQDKLVSNEQCFGLRVFADQLNNLHFKKVTVLDPHSNIASHLINEFEAVYPVEEVEQAYKRVGATKVVYPDAGAYLKYITIYPYPAAWCKKERDSLTGTIKHMELVGGNIKGENVLIVDDICDGGRTFTMLADILYGFGARDISLFVTHGIFSKGLDDLRTSGITYIYTAKGQAHKYQGQISYTKQGRI